MGDALTQQSAEPSGYFDYITEKVNTIRSAIAGYVGGAAIASELTQNADDAPADLIRFQFTPDALLVHNSGVFTQRDFRNITHIGSGGHRNDEGKIGTWGTGFLSVYQIADYPELESAGLRVRFDPTKERIPHFPSAVGEATLFRFPWRRERTDLAIELEADPWTESRIEAFKNELAVEVYRQIIFLRNVRTIEVYDGENDPKLLYRVHKERAENTQWDFGFTREVFEVSYYRKGQKEIKDKWVYYRGYMPETSVPEGYKVKDREVTIAFPLTKRAWLKENIPGYLYNFLPTQIRTGFAFQINGAFAPKSDRTTVLMDTSIKADWNRRLIQRLAQLFTDILDDIRASVGDDSRFFYELLPLQYNQDHPFLEPIRAQFTKEAPGKRLVYSSLGEWETPDRIKVGGSANLQKLFEKYIAVLPAGATQEFRNFLSDELSRPPLRLADALTYLSSQLKPNTPLKQAPIINSYQNLAVIYQIAQQEWNRLQTQISEPYVVTMLRRQLESVPLCLDEDGVLKNFSDKIWRGDDVVRNLVLASDVCFVDRRLQTDYPTLLADFLDDFGSLEFLNYLQGELTESYNQSLASASKLVNDRKKLQDVICFLYHDLERLPAHQLAVTPLILDNQAILRAAQDKIYFYDDTYERQLLTSLNLTFVDPALSQDEKVLAVYRKAGVSKLTPRDVITQLEQLCPNPVPLAQAAPAIANIKALRDLYGYFARYSQDLGPDDKRRLRQLPIYLTQEGRLAAIDDPHTPLKLPVHAGAAWQSNLDVLGLDNLIHSDILNGHIRHFLNKVLGVEELSPFIIIRDYLLQHYNNSHLSHPQRLKLLEFVRITWDELNVEQREELHPTLTKTQLVRCQDGEYRCGSEVYFASPALDAVFVSEYYHPHPDYGIPKAQPKDDDQRPYDQKKWYRLFCQLGLKEYPTPADLVDAVERVVSAGPPTEERVDAVRRIYTVLQAEVGRLYQADDPVLCGLRSIAWLPASNDPHWHKPPNIYPPQFTQLVGNQAPILQFREKENTNQLLRLPANVPIVLVVEHLRDTARKNERVHLSIYDYLGSHLDELPAHIFNILKKEAVVWDGNNGFQLPNRVFFDNYRHLFGKRRWYLSPPNADARRFLERIGVRKGYHPWQDSIALIQEIAADYANGQIIEDEDHELLLENFDHLGQQVPNGDSNLLSELQILQPFAIIPSRDKQLHLPNRIVLADQPEILAKFDDNAFPVVDEEGLTEAIRCFLRRIGVAQLSKTVERRAVSTKGSQEDTAFNLRMERLATAFDRIELTIREDNSDYSQDNLPSEQLRKVRFFVVPRLQVAYSLNLTGEKITGYKCDELTLYDTDSGYFYVKQERRGEISQKSHRPLAKELECIFFPNARQSIVIEQLLNMPLSEVHNFLTDHNYRKILAKHIEYGHDATGESLAGWSEDSPPLWQQLGIPQDEGAEQPPLFTPTQMPLPTPPQASLPPTSKPTAETEPATPPQPEPPESKASQAESEPVAPQPTDDGALMPPDTATPPAGKTTQPDGDSDKAPHIPPFTGQRWPISIRQPNDYARLSQEFGLPLDTKEGNSPTQTSDDTTWEPVQPVGREKDTNTDRVTIVRFTLKYQNRYEGFLTLHSRARQMLADHPQILTCLTDYPDEWSFKLYIDYSNPGMIYNEVSLPQFFDTFNIPAGGIIYLERLEAHNTVRLFWKNVEQTVPNVKRYELTKNGEVEAFSTDMKVSCEIDEHILRAETRLEDIEAFIHKSIDQPGVFTLICEAFGKDNAELSYNEIFDWVQSKRPVADFTIRVELYARPCFVPIGDNRWRFEPSRGNTPALPEWTGNKQHSKIKVSTRTQSTVTSQQAAGPTVPETTTQQPVTLPPEPAPPLPPPSPYQIALNEAQQEWHILSDFFNLDGHDPVERLQGLVERLSKFLQRLQLSLQTLAQPVQETDDLLTTLWQNLAKNVTDKDAQRNLQQCLREKFTQGDHNPLPDQLSHLLVRTDPQQCELVFFPMLSDIASQLAETGNVTPARQVYQMLREHGAGDFETQLAQLKKFNEVQEYIDLAQIAETAGERWQVWRDAWQEYPGFPPLRQAIQQEVKQQVVSAEQNINSCFSRGKTQLAFEIYIRLVDEIVPLNDAWQTDQKSTSLVWGLARRVFEALRREALRTNNHIAFRQALQIAAKLPAGITWELSGGIYLEAAQSVAESFKSRSDNLAAAVLLDYAIYYVGKNHWPVNDYVLSVVFEHVGSLYENLAVVYRAYDFIHQAQRKALTEKKQRLGQRAYGLRQQRDKIDASEERQSWQAQIEALAYNPDFIQLVNQEIFEAFCHN